MAEYYSKHTGQEIDDAVDAMSEAENKYVSVDEQTFSDEQKAKARENIGAQDKITGTEGQFVVIGSDGNVTTKTIPSAEGVSF